MLTQPETYAETLRGALRASRKLFIILGIFSFFVNLLMLTGPLYMLQVYDRVLSSQSIPTLLALSGLVAVLFIGYGVLEIIRSGLFSRVASRFEQDVAGPAFEGAIAASMREKGRVSDQPVRDVRTIRQFISSPALTAVYDMPWSPVFLIAIFLLHPYLGLLGLAGAGLLISLAISNELLTREHFQKSNEAAMASQAHLSAITRNVEAVEAMGMRAPLQARWAQAQREAGHASLVAGDRNGMFSSTIKAFRLFLQSAMLGLGAYLAIQQQITPGVMIAASIILGRAVAPVEQGVGQWRNFVGSRDAWGRLKDLLTNTDTPAPRMPLPPISGAVQAAGLYVAPPGSRTPTLRDLNFVLEPGTALGVIGPSASGKSTLARALIGLWPPLAGAVRLDGAEVHTQDRSLLGPQIGYLPQEVELIAGKVHENISRFDPEVNPEAVVDAAKAAGCHDLILRLPDGYETEIGHSGGFLSAGQRQRIALARALYKDPPVIVLDEPNANLDTAGDEALSQTIQAAKARGRTVVVITHRPSALAHVDKLLVLEQGAVRAFGDRDEVMRSVFRPAAVQSGAAPAERPGAGAA